MKLHNLKIATQQVNFKQAVIQGIGQERGLFFVNRFKPLENLDEILTMDFVERSSHIIHHLIDSELSFEQVNEMVSNAFNFDVPMVEVTDNMACLELFHGQTLAFKDFGARFMAQCVKAFNDKNEVTILTATSGDTGAAVAHAFYKIPGIHVKILYPKGKISNLQEKLFCTLGENIETYAVQGDFDDCQTMVKAAFDSDEIRNKHHLTSANSINISRLLAQVCYYFEIVSKYCCGNIVVSVPSGNFGNLTAGLIARQIGAPIKRFIAATNANDTVPRYLIENTWLPNKTVETVANAIQSKNRAWIIAFCSMGLALLSLATLILILPLKTFEPYVVTVDQSTGYVEVIKGLQAGDLSEDQAITQSNLVRYVSAREQYNPAVLEKNYDFVSLMSGGKAAKEFQQLWAGSNPDNPSIKLGRGAYIDIKIKSVSFLNDKTASVRFLREHRENDRVRISHWNAIIEFQYSQKPMRMSDRFSNPLGFQVISYRVNPEVLESIK
ncbi:MAG: threonine synthase [Proteobacteria bacterium]|nr:threonine synthase [Pseudomonadota bacterium]